MLVRQEYSLYCGGINWSLELDNSGGTGYFSVGVGNCQLGVETRSLKILPGLFDFDYQK
ncbi:unnamed protein product [marine sediment metagenome]|uniref:Uncharacterized protein n=1 Tax=marine sediment metagenome TaxID=412755 RepID=X1T122_9ZZZZ